MIRFRLVKLFPRVNGGYWLVLSVIHHCICACMFSLLKLRVMCVALNGKAVGVQK